MRRISQIAALALLLIVALPATAALAAEPVGVDDPPAAFDDGVAAVAADPDAAVEGAAGDSVAGIADATVEETPEAAAQVAAPAATATAAQAQVAATGQLPFTGIDSSLIPVISLVGSLLLIGGALLYIVTGTRREAVREAR